MPIREVLQLGHPLLRQPCAVVDDPTSPAITALVDDLAATVADWRARTGYGRAIAAPQIGELVRVIVLVLPGEEKWPLINPRIVWHSEDQEIVWDACLSFLEIFVQVPRWREIRVAYQDLAGREHEVHAGKNRDLAELLQHEIDHLDGILTVDRMIDVKTLCTRQEFERRYRDTSPYADPG